MRIPVIIAVVLVCLSVYTSTPRYVPHDGDIVFQTSMSSQSLAIQRATHSKYSHMGIVFVMDGKPYVLEAVQPVKMTPLSKWIARGEGEHVVVKRLRTAEHVLTSENVAKLKSEAKTFEGKPYDLYFEWSDDKIYCSELVWKIYQRALGVELGKMQHLGDFDLTDKAVKAKIEERWHGNPPLQEPVVSPAAIFESEHLETAYSR